MSSFAQTNVFDVARKGTVEDITAIYKSNPEIINSTDKNGYSALTLACYHGNESVAAFLIENVSNINGKSDYGTPLMASVVKGNATIVKLLLDKKADTSITDANGTTALHYATFFKHTDIVKLLVNAGAKSNIKDGRGQSALDYATLSKSDELIKLFENNN